MSDLINFFNLAPQARTVYQHMRKAGDISALDAMVTYGISSASLARRIGDIKAAGIPVDHQKRKHPITGKGYTRYVLSAAA